MWRRNDGRLEVLLVHPGGPYWAKKDVGAWSLPKGEHEQSEEALAAARREFTEETGAISVGPYAPLGSAKQPSGKLIVAWAFRGDFDPTALVSNQFELEWPPHSGVRRTFPEIDRAAWFELDEARSKLQPGQLQFLDRLVKLIDHSPDSSG